jgi:hypothetical protein
LSDGIHDEPEREEYPEADSEADCSSKHADPFTRIVWIQQKD